MKIYAISMDKQQVLYGDHERYRCKPRWYVLRESKKGKFIIWRGRRVYLKEDSMLTTVK